MDIEAIKSIASEMEKDFSERMNRAGLMFRLFSRVKTERSIRHKLDFKGGYRSGKKKIQDIIGFRVVVYFQDDVDVLSLLFGCNDVVKMAVDEFDDSTFRPQRLNITHNIPEKHVDIFRKSLPEDIAQYIDNTYEIQIRTIFSEGWHEVEHDLRYKCKEDWNGYDSFSRTLNGMIATLETAEWSMKSLFHEMAYQNFLHKNYRAMLRNKMRIRLTDNDFSPEVGKFLQDNPETAKKFIDTNRVVFVLSLLSHNMGIDLTYDNVLFLVNRLEIHNAELLALEGEATRLAMEKYLAS
ncbi:MAG: GTP pyrophosphokinase [Prevotellaceae bacterium]|nr:GTP pyrophosphokinase [Prevotellaceae bacterium]